MADLWYNWYEFILRKLIPPKETSNLIPPNSHDTVTREWERFLMYHLRMVYGSLNLFYFTKINQCIMIVYVFTFVVLSIWSPNSCLWWINEVAISTVLYSFVRANRLFGEPAINLALITNRLTQLARLPSLGEHLKWSNLSSEGLDCSIRQEIMLLYTSFIRVHALLTFILTYFSFACYYSAPL